MYNKISYKYKRQQNIRHGKCPRCGQALRSDDIGKLCDNCRRKNAEYVRKNRGQGNIAKETLDRISKKFHKR